MIASVINSLVDWAANGGWMIFFLGTLLSILLLVAQHGEMVKKYKETKGFNRFVAGCVILFSWSMVGITAIGGVGGLVASARSDRTVGGLTKEIANLTNEITHLESDKVALSNRLQTVEWNSYPRNFRDRKAASERLSQFSGTPVLVVWPDHPDPETENIVYQIGSVLGHARWTFAKTNAYRKIFSTGTDNDWCGVRIWEARTGEVVPKSVIAADVLLTELKRTGILGQHRHNFPEGISSNAPLGLLVVWVGAKPTPIQVPLLALYEQLDSPQTSPEERENAIRSVRELLK